MDTDTVYLKEMMYCMGHGNVYSVKQSQNVLSRVHETSTCTHKRKKKHGSKRLPVQANRAMT